jgi:hypothetical protein
MQMKNIIVWLSFLGLVCTLTGCDNSTDAKAQQTQTPPPTQQQIVPQKVPERPLTGGEDFLSGPVIKIFGNAPGLESSSISMYVSGKGIYGGGGGETVRLGDSIYGIHIQTSNGVYVIQFKGDRVYAISSLISIGITVRFPTRYYVRDDFFNNMQMGGDKDAILFGLNKISEEIPWVPSWDQIVEILPPEPTLLEQKQK